jgi:hypothetical protein
MVSARLASAAVLAAVLVFSSVAMAQVGGAANEQTDAQKKAEAEQKAKAAATALAAKTSYEGYFQSEVLAGNTVNDFRVPQPASQLITFTSTLTWKKEAAKEAPKEPDSTAAKKEAAKTGACESAAGTISVASKTPQRDNLSNTVLGIHIGKPPCLWPLRQTAIIQISALTTDGERKLFDGEMSVSVLWFPLMATLLILVLIYPGCAATRWYLSKRRYRRTLAAARKSGKPPAITEAPSFWVALDPVELTKNPYGRGSIAKLQIFLFSFIVFALLLFHVMRTGFLASMSADVLYLMGISALGAAGGKVAYMARRRLSLGNWVWLRRKGWLAPAADVSERAQWSELFVDSDTKEFDPYRFQMAIFSLVVAIALISSSAIGLEAFKIPTELLGLLGISQTVFVAGQAIDKGGYEELDEKITQVRTHEQRYQELKTKADAEAAKTPPSTEAAVAATTELKAFKTAVAEAADMFWAVYGEEVDAKKVAAVEPEMHYK